MLITVTQLNYIHYYYFAMGIFALANAFLIGLDSLLSVVLFFFYIANSVIAWYVANIARKSMSEFMIVESISYFLKHVILSIAVVSLTILVWTSDLITGKGVFSLILTINYMVLFLGGMWFVITRTDFSKKLFSVYNNRLFQKSKEFIISMMRARPKFFGRDIVTTTEIKEYKYGSIKEVDDNMMSAWKNKGQVRYVMECIGRIQLALAYQALNMLKDKIGFLKIHSDEPERESLMIKTENAFATKERAVNDFENKFYAKSGDTELS